MTAIASDRDRLHIAYAPRFYLAFYLFFMLVMVIVAAREAMAGRQDAALVWLAAGAAVGIGAIALFIESTEIVLDRAAGTVTLRSRRAFGRATRRAILADVVSVYSEGPFGKDKGSSQRPVLVLRDGSTMPLRLVYMPRRESRRIAGAINDWLALA